ncbi:hypothetical protein Y032_0004g1936 [Ancylostoma ceylanicum]|uniref:CCHC-type domain-containing protein n=1 Tax=Ancylostoma ceylanicum TaxID=53326 RepID=A0A016VU32_9BILA|nr:hypothetical protein Y032_0004g1936 [Ancylostoma ceylanicum]
MRAQPVEHIVANVLRLRPNQEISDFCNVIEKLGRQANPDCTIEDRSMEYAQVLLDNLGHWPEHFQLLGALHKVEPRKAYDEIKQLALSIEQPKMMLSAQREPYAAAWKSRASYYSQQEEGGGRYQSWSNDVDTNEEGPCREREEACQGRNRLSGNETQMVDREGQVQERQCSTSLRTNESRKCYNCSKYGDIGRDCPRRSTRVNQIDCGTVVPVDKERKLSEIIRDVRSLEMSVKRGESSDEGLIGSRMLISLMALGRKYSALIDTGSMISIAPVGMLAEAQDRGVDVDALKLIGKSSQG